MYASLKEGGSTITQQLTKIIFLTPEKTLQRKLREARLAIRLEKELTKEEIFDLVAYLESGGVAAHAAFRKQP